MKRIPKSLERSFCEELERRGVEATRRDCLKWLRYYLDFCWKYDFAPREQESLPPFLQKLAAKGQGERLQAQAAESLKLFYEVVKRFPPPGARAEQAERRPDRHAEWRDCMERVEG